MLDCSKHAKFRFTFRRRRLAVIEYSCESHFGTIYALNLSKYKRSVLTIASRGETNTWTISPAPEMPEELA